MITANQNPEPQPISRFKKAVTGGTHDFLAGVVPVAARLQPANGARLPLRSCLNRQANL